MRVLLIESDGPSAHYLRKLLENHSFAVIHADEGRKGLIFARNSTYDIIVTELSLSDMSGFDVIDGLRKAKVAVPIFVLSGLSGVEDKVRALSLGADDYLTKPYHADEALARLRAILRRSAGQEVPQVTCGPLVVDLSRRVVKVAEQTIRLTRKEYMVLELLAQNQGVLVTHEQFFACLYPAKEVGHPEKGLMVFTCKLRRKLAMASGGDSFIETISGCGYMLPRRENVPQHAVA